MHKKIFVVWLLALLIFVDLSGFAFGMESSNYSIDSSLSFVVSWFNMSSDNFTTDGGIDPSWIGTWELAVPAPAAPAAPAPGGPAAPVTIEKVTNFTLSLERIEERLEINGSKVLELVITNNGEKAVNISLEAKGDIKPWVFFDKTNFPLDVNETKTVKIRLQASGRFGDIYTGSIIVSGDGVEKAIPIVLIVKAKVEKLLDIRVEVLDKYVSPGDKVRFHVSIFNLGTDRRVDVKLIYGIEKDGKLLTSKEEMLAVETQASLLRSFVLAPNVEEGEYVFRVWAEYDSLVAQSSDSFTVAVEKPVPVEFPINLKVLLLILIIIVSLILVKKKGVIKRKDKIIKRKGGKKVEMKVCKSCGYANDPDSKYCIKCGEKI
jgi:ribosomal protein L40E